MNAGNAWGRSIGIKLARLLGGAGVLALALASADAQAPRPKDEAKVAPRFEPVAETKLLMEGLALPNYQSASNLLKEKTEDPATWAFIRGQALLIAETGNLLLLRPPRNQGQDAWFRNAMDLRAAGADLARHAGNRDFARSRAGLLEVANTCNRCHQTFRVKMRVGAAEKK